MNMKPSRLNSANVHSTEKYDKSIIVYTNCANMSSACMKNSIRTISKIYVSNENKWALMQQESNVRSRR